MERGFVMTKRQEKIVFCLLSVARRHRKKYCYPSQFKIVELTKLYGGVQFSRRTLNRDLRFLEDNGFIERVRRIKRGPDGSLVMRSTLYKFTGKLFNYLFSLGNSVRRVFSFFRVPSWAQNLLDCRKQASFFGPAPASKLLIRGRDGKILVYEPRSGLLSER
jgi:hypothetical protein